MNKRLYSVATVAALLVLTAPAFAGNLVNVSGAGGAALDGYDPVAFFTTTSR
jgi:hypothetical protein